MECSCLSAGLGAYPETLNSKSGHGPAEPITKEMIEKPEHFECDFETVKNFDIWRYESTRSVRSLFRNLNITLQYWFAIHVFKIFPMSSRNLKIVATFIASAYWHDIYPGILFPYFIMFAGIVLEDFLNDLFKPKEMTPRGVKVYSGFMWFFTCFIRSSFAISYTLVDAEKIWKFYNSIYHCIYVILAFLYIVCFIGFWRRKRKDKMS